MCKDYVVDLTTKAARLSTQVHHRWKVFKEQKSSMSRTGVLYPGVHLRDVVLCI